MVEVFVWLFFRVLVMTRCHQFPCMDPWFLSGGFWSQWNTCVPKFQRSKAGIPSIRRIAAREIISASVELRETEVCFLHIQLIGTNVWLPKMHKTPPDVDFESSKSPAKSESSNNPNRHCCAVCFPQGNIVWIHLCDESKKSHLLNVCRMLSSTSWWHGQACSLTIKYHVCHFEPNTCISEQFERTLLRIFRQILFLLLWIDGRQYMELRLVPLLSGCICKFAKFFPAILFAQPTRRILSSVAIGTIPSVRCTSFVRDLSLVWAHCPKPSFSLQRVDVPIFSGTLSTWRVHSL